MPGDLAQVVLREMLIADQMLDQRLGGAAEDAIDKLAS